MKRRRPRRRSGWSALSTAARVALVAFATLVLVVGAAFTAANIVPPTNVDDQTLPDRPVVPSPPSECSGITTTNTISGSGVIVGTDGNDWIIGSDAIDTIDGLGGNDCIEGKGGDDIIDGGVNLDLTPGSDVCLGGAGTDTFASCETEIQ